MMYPRIYSLSTVGIMKHYIHDYLFHPQRTDFIGPNGVGKSIIADLLQLMFIYDTEVIKFGTDGLQQDKRSIETLPYKSRLAYCFLNIEIRKNEFIIIGILISSLKGKRLTPFVITRSPELSEALDKLVLGPQEILFANDILKGDVIPDIADLTKELSKSKNLYLNSFRTKDDIQTYYRFLFDKNILSINLCVDKNFSAFSKVIQSFSKAKTLTLEGSKASRSLKEFLFEDSDEDLVRNYANQQAVLDRILKEYKRLDQDVKSLSKKSDSLIQLKEQQEQSRRLFKEYKTIELTKAYFSLQDIRNLEIEGQNALEQAETHNQSLSLKSQKISRIEKLLNKGTDKANANYDLVSEYTRLSSVIEELDNEITELRMVILPTIHTDWKKIIQRIDISTRTVKEIKALVAFAEPYLKKFKTLNEIESARDTQIQRIDSIKTGLQKEHAEKCRLKELLEGQTSDSIIHWFIDQGKSVSSEKLHAILHFASTPTKKIERPKQLARFINPEQLFREFDIVNDEHNKGYWIRLGAMSEFVAFDERVSLFEFKESFDKSVIKLVESLNSEISGINQKLEELKKINNGKPYNKKLVPEEFDLSLIEYSNIERVISAVSCILQFDEKLMAIQREKIKNETSLSTLKLKINTSHIGSEPEVVKKGLSIIRNRWIERQKKFSKYSGVLSKDLEAAEKLIQTNRNDLSKITKSVLEQTSRFADLTSNYYAAFNQNVDVFSSEDTDLEKIEEQYKKAEHLYQSTFIGIIHQFDETSNAKNTAVNLEIEKRTYSFRVLEEALLGSRIKSTDDIAAALDDANQNRLMMADGIRDNMIKVFENTVSRYKQYKEQTQVINTFFKGRKISNRFLFKLGFLENKVINISFVEEMAGKVRLAAKQGELAFNESVDEFLENFFKRLAKIKDTVPIDKLLNPKTYFELSVSLTDEFDNEIPGSTGETYSAIALLGIARLSVVQKEQRSGLRFIILEEIGSLDNTNFNTFPAIAEEFGYQIITMAPHPFNIGFADEWFAHHLIKGSSDKNINLCPSASYFKTNAYSERLELYQNRMKNELDRIESA